MMSKELSPTQLAARDFLYTNAESIKGTNPLYGRRPQPVYASQKPDTLHEGHFKASFPVNDFGRLTLNWITKENHVLPTSLTTDYITPSGASDRAYRSRDYVGLGKESMQDDETSSVARQLESAQTSIDRGYVTHPRIGLSLYPEAYFWYYDENGEPRLHHDKQYMDDSYHAEMSGIPSTVTAADRYPQILALYKDHV